MRATTIPIDKDLAYRLDMRIGPRLYRVPRPTIWQDADEQLSDRLRDADD